MTPSQVTFIPPVSAATESDFVVQPVPGGGFGWSMINRLLGVGVPVWS